MTTTLAQTTTALDLLVARASKESAMTTISVHQILATPLFPADVSSPQFLPANATCADLWFALQFLAAPLDARMELVVQLQFLAMIETPALSTLAIQPPEPANTLQWIAMITISAHTTFAILKAVATTWSEMPPLSATTTTFAQTTLAIVLLDA